MNTFMATDDKVTVQ